MEQLRRYLDTIPILYVTEDESSSPLCDIFTQYCAKLTKVRLSELVNAKSGQLRFPFVIMELFEATRSSCSLLVEKVTHLEVLLSCGNSDDIAVFDMALAYRFSAVISQNPSSKELTDKLKNILLSLSVKQREKAKTDNYQKIVEDSASLFCVKRADKIVFANQKLLNYCSVSNTGELNTLGSKVNELLDMIRFADGSSRSVCRHVGINGESFILDAVGNSNEQIITCTKLVEESNEQKDFLTHIEFVELLKDVLVHRNVIGDPLFEVAIKLENSQKIITDFGSEFFYSFFKKFALFCGIFFEKAPTVFWNYDYMITLVEDYQVDSVKEKANQLFVQAGQFKYEKEVIPFIELSVMELKHLPINDAISMMDRVYSKNLTLIQSGKICLNKSSTTVSVADGQMAMYHIQNIVQKDYKIKLLNIYKGLSISGPSKIIKISDDEIYVQTEKLQKYLMHIEKSVVIQSEYIPKEIHAEVKYVDITEPYAILKNPVFLEHSANSRKNARVQCDTRIPVTMTVGKYTLTGELFDLSIQAIAIRYKNKVDEDMVDNEAKLTFSLPHKYGENGMVKVTVSGKVMAIKNIDDQTRIITAIKLDEQNEANVLEYIYKRQKELITEIKKLGSMIFK